LKLRPGSTIVDALSRTKGSAATGRPEPGLHLRREDRAERAVSTSTRAGALAAGALALGGAAALARGAAPTPRDVRVLGFALVLEQFEDLFYRAALDAGVLRGELLRYAQTVADHERRHTRFLTNALGSAATPPPRVDVRRSVRSADAFTQAAIRLEDTAVAAYNGQAANVSPAILLPAARIVSVEARHAAWIRSIAGQPPAADPVDPARTEAQVRDALAELGLRS
jgi:hypothetical protein